MVIVNSQPEVCEITLSTNLTKSLFSELFRNHLISICHTPNFDQFETFYSYFKVFTRILNSQNLCFIFRQVTRTFIRFLSI